MKSDITLLINLLESAALLSIFLGFYYFFLRKLTSFTANRIILLSGIILSCSLPFFNFTVSGDQSTEIITYTLPAVLIDGETNSEVTSTAQSFDWLQMALYIYFLGLAFCLGRSARRAFKLNKLLSKLDFDEHGIAIVNGPVPTFSFLNKILINEKDLKNNELDAILAHERAHVEQRHSFDLILIDLVKCFQWFNPAAWHYSKALQETHEYLADRSSLEKIEQSRSEYGALLARQGIAQLQYAYGHAFAEQIKNRITMINQKKSSKWSGFRYAFLIPLIAFLIPVIACSEGESPLAANNDDEQKYFHEGAEPIKDPDVLPEFPGGMDSLMVYLGRVEYPEAAKLAGNEGKVMVEFGVEYDGTVQSAEVLPASLDAPQSLQDVAVAHVLAMPDWAPGEKDGKPVLTKMVIPFNFVLPKEGDN